MNNKKTRNKIYYYIDLFFLLLPILLLISFYFIYFSYSITEYSRETLRDFWSYDASYPFTCFVDFFLEGFIENWSSIGGVLQYFLNFTDDLFSWFGIAFEGDPYIIYFIQVYFLYIFFYEFLSLFINIVLWLPRYIRSWIQEKGVNV